MITEEEESIMKIETPKKHYYSNEFKMINRIAKNPEIFLEEKQGDQNTSKL